MSGRRIALIFMYAYASMTVPVWVLLWVKPILNQALTNWIVKNLPVTLVLIFVYSFGQLYIWTMMASWAAAVQPATAKKVSIQELKARLLSLNDERLPLKSYKIPWRGIEFQQAERSWMRNGLIFLQRVGFNPIIEIITGSGWGFRPKLLST